MKYALSSDQLTDAVMTYLLKHGHQIVDGAHEVEIMTSKGNGFVTISFTQRTPVTVELEDPAEHPIGSGRGVPT